MVLKECTDEWGAIKIDDPKAYLGYSMACQYSKGVLKSEPFSPDILQKKIVSVRGYGSWTHMDYLLKIED